MARTHGLEATYNAGCRCPMCSFANAAHTREQQRAQRLAAQWVRETHPEMWKAFKAQAAAGADGTEAK